LKRQHWVIIGALAAGWIILLGQPTALSGGLRSLFSSLGTPFVKLGDLIPTFHSRRQLSDDNTKLRTENALLRQQLNTLAEAGRENIRLHELLSLKQHIAPRTLGAHVIGRDTSNWWRSIQIDRGSNNGLRENMAVLSSAGLVGKITTVTTGNARVLLLIDPNCKVSAVLQDTRTTGIVAGANDAFMRDPHCVMTYVNRDAKLHQNETVISSGLGGVFPKGILIGTVTSAQLNPQTGMYQDIEIKPSVDFHRIEEVIIILE
jgi:rod shape-determining protein MreC